jgi:hypothetical protein
MVVVVLRERIHWMMTKWRKKAEGALQCFDRQPFDTALLLCFAVQLDAAVGVLKLYRSEAALVAAPVDSEESGDSSISTAIDTALLPAHIRYAQRTLSHICQFDSMPHSVIVKLRAHEQHCGVQVQRAL